MTYSELLQKREWIEKSASIIQRDSFRCQECGSLGFHSMSMYICKDSQELNRNFKEWAFNGLSLSEFIDKEIKASSNNEGDDDSEFGRIRSFLVSPFNIINNDERFQLNGYTFYRLSSSVFDFDFVNRNAYCFCKKKLKERPIYHRHIVEKATDNIIANGLIIEKDGSRITNFEWGNTYVFEKDIVEDYIVSIEYIYPTGPNGVAFSDYPIDLYGSIVLSITYRNFVGSFYFIPHKDIIGLNVHHKYYIKGNAPWEYENDALITLCEDCHKKAHLSQIPVYRKIDAKKVLYRNAITCDRCNGSGYLPQYAHVENGICFKCWGEGVVLDTLE